MLFDKLDIPSFDGLSADEAWEACEDWEAWAADSAESFTDYQWDDIVDTIRSNYDRYYEKYE